MLVYGPAAVVRHGQGQTLPAVRVQLANNGIGYYGYLVRNARALPAERWTIARHGFWWFGYWNLRRWCLSLLQPRAFPRDLINAEIAGSLVGLTRYRTALRRASAIEREFGPQRAYNTGLPPLCVGGAIDGGRQ